MMIRGQEDPDMFLGQAFTVRFSMFAALFWMSAASGRTVEWPWRETKTVLPDDLPTHQAKWNAWAALSAGAAAVSQASTFLAERNLFPFPPLPPH
jgi:hypothetical protein